KGARLWRLTIWSKKNWYAVEGKTQTLRPDGVYLSLASGNLRRGFGDRSAPRLRVNHRTEINQGTCAGKDLRYNIRCVSRGAFDSRRNDPSFGLNKFTQNHGWIPTTPRNMMCIYELVFTFVDCTAVFIPGIRYGARADAGAKIAAAIESRGRASSHGGQQSERYRHLYRGSRWRARPGGHNRAKSPSACI